MDPQIAAAFSDMADRLTKFFTDGMFVVTKPYRKLWSNEVTLNNAGDLQQRGRINITSGIAGPARFLRILTNVNGTLFISKQGDSTEIEIHEPLIANVAIRIYDEDVTHFRLEPNAYPVTVRYICSR
jgi:hypothetical protein